MDITKKEKPEKVAKQKPEVPKTEISQNQDKSARKYYLIMGTIVGLIVIIGGYVIYRLATQFQHQSNVNKAQDMLITALEKKQKNLKELQPNYDAITAKGSNGTSDSELILRAVPTTQSYDNLIAILEKMGQESGVKVTSVSQSSSTSGASTTATGNAQTSTGQPIPFTFTVNVEGSYSSIIEFLKKTEKSARVINFNSMSINGTSGEITANLTMSTNYQPEANINSTFEPLK